MNTKPLIVRQSTLTSKSVCNMHADLKQIDIDRQVKFEALIIEEFGEAWNTEKRGYGRYKYHDIQRRWEDFLFGSYPYPVLTEFQTKRIDSLRTEAVQFEQMAAKHRIQIDLIKRGRVL